MKAILGLVLVVLVAGAFVVYSGMIDISAAKPEAPVVRWFLSTVSDRSVEKHAKGIAVPQLGSPEQLKRGFDEYREECAVCHGAPGMDPTGLAKGLNPRAPKFSRGTDLSPEELFWVTKNGIKMTGMPAWGPSHDDAEIWDLVAFVQQLDKVTPGQYKAMSLAAEMQESAAGKKAGGSAEDEEKEGGMGKK